MLWGNLDKKKDFETHVREAAAFFEKKYGRTAAVCRAHETFVPDGVEEVGGVAVKAVTTVPNYHLWIGDMEAS